MIRLALINCALSFTLGALVLMSKSTWLGESWWSWRTSHIHLALIGWIVQFACGVATWIMPRFPGARPHGNMTLAQVCGVALNVGVYGMVARDVLLFFAVQILPEAILILSGSLYALAAVSFVLHVWRRVRPMEIVFR